jgi:hypothetical protein
MTSGSSAFEIGSVVAHSGIDRVAIATHRDRQGCRREKHQGTLVLCWSSPKLEYPFNSAHVTRGLSQAAFGELEPTLSPL